MEVKMKMKLGLFVVVGLLTITKPALAVENMSVVLCPTVSKVEVTKEVTLHHPEIRGLKFGAEVRISGPVRITCEGDRMTITGTGTASLTGHVTVFLEQ